MIEPIEPRATILVVDDSRLMRVAARKILRNDFDILEAEDGEAAWDLLKDSDNITLVMSDLSMPNLDGMGLLARIRNSDDPGLRELPVIIVTGAEDDDGSKASALSAGASDFITKPFESVQLLARAKAQARQQSTQQALRASEDTKQKLEAQSKVDPLTGLANRHAFHDALEEKLAYAIRYRTELALLLVQIDRYKVMFLRHGKNSADKILLQVARLLGSERRREDTVARISLDTFGILLPAANPLGARRVAEQLCHSAEGQEFDIDGEAVPVTLSIGVSTPLLHAEVKADTLLNEAAGRLAEAHQAGGGCIRHGHEQQPAAPDDATHESNEAAAPATAAIADANDVRRALQALSEGNRPDHPIDDLARAVIPLLDLWNEAHDHSHSAPLAELRKLLQLPEPAPATAPARS